MSSDFDSTRCKRCGTVHSDYEECPKGKKELEIKAEELKSDKLFTDVDWSMARTCFKVQEPLLRALLLSHYGLMSQMPFERKIEKVEFDGDWFTFTFAKKETKK